VDSILNLHGDMDTITNPSKPRFNMHLEIATLSQIHNYETFGFATLRCILDTDLDGYMQDKDAGLNESVRVMSQLRWV